MSSDFDTELENAKAGMSQSYCQALKEIQEQNLYVHKERPLLFVIRNRVGYNGELTAEDQKDVQARNSVVLGEIGPVSVEDFKANMELMDSMCTPYKLIPHDFFYLPFTREVVDRLDNYLQPFEDCRARLKTISRDDAAVFIPWIEKHMSDLSIE